MQTPSVAQALLLSALCLLLLLFLLAPHYTPSPQDVSSTALKEAVEGLMQSAGLHVVGVPLQGSSRALLLFYGPRVFKQHTVTTLKSLAEQYGRQPPPWLQQLLQQECADTAGCLAFVRLGEQQQQQDEEEGEDGSYELVCRDTAAAKHSSEVDEADMLAVLRLLRKDLEQAFSTAAAAVREARALQQQKQQQAYRQVLERIYASAATAAAAPAAAGTTTSSSSSNNSSSSSITELLLPQLTVSPPEGQADSFDYISQAWKDYSDSKILDIDSILGPGVQPTRVQRWLLPQLLDDAQPPLLVVAPPGTGRVTAVLLAAAAELAAAAAGEQEGEEGEEEAAAAAAAAAAGDGGGDGIDSEGEAEGGDGDGEGLGVVLPWEVDDALGAAGSVLNDEDQQQQAQQVDASLLTAGPDSTAAAAAEGEDGIIDGSEACSPFLLLMLPTQAAAEAAAAQHGPAMAAAGVRLGLLPLLNQQLQQQWEAAVEDTAERDLQPRMEELTERQHRADKFFKQQQLAISLAAERVAEAEAAAKEPTGRPKKQQNKQSDEGTQELPSERLQGVEEAQGPGYLAAELSRRADTTGEDSTMLRLSQEELLVKLHQQVSGYL